eukprot:scaffold72269_cov23-Tisochrysis_lutea.AAC.1
MEHMQRSHALHQQIGAYAVRLPSCVKRDGQFPVLPPCLATLLTKYKCGHTLQPELKCKCGCELRVAQTQIVTAIGNTERITCGAVPPPPLLTNIPDKQHLVFVVRMHLWAWFTSNYNIIAGWLQRSQVKKCQSSSSASENAQLRAPKIAQLRGCGVCTTH